MMVATRLSSLPLFGPNGPSLALSRRDYRTQPGVLTPGNTPTPRPALKGRKIFLIDGSLGKALRTAGTPVLPPLQGGTFFDRPPGLKPRAESYYPRPHRYAKRCGLGLRDKFDEPLLDNMPGS